jgi:hypothetical protein
LGIVHDVPVPFLEPDIFVEGMLRYFPSCIFVLVGIEFGLALSADLEGVQDPGQSWLWSDPDKWGLVHEPVDPWDLAYGGEVVKSFSRIHNEIADILFLIDETIVAAKANVRCHVSRD